MSTRRQTSRTLRPSTEALEGRRLLSKTITGTDADGDTWSLTLTGPGDFRVTNQADSTGTPVALGDPAQIDSIEIAGPVPTETRLIGKVTKGANGDGKVFFQSLTEQGGRSEGPVATNGIYAIDMPDFWLGHTDTTAPTGSAGSISIPDGIVTLRFGGVDTTFTPTGGTPLNQNNTNDAFTVNLGLPRTRGTSIIIQKSVSDGQAATTSTGSPTQDSVTFSVAGRLNVFQADEIDGNTAVPTTGFIDPQSGVSNGTIVRSIADTATGVTGQIGFVRVGNNATNFSTQTNGQISNYYVGGEANNVLVLAPTGLRNVYFGKGMDTAQIFTHALFTIQANRGAINSTVVVERAIGSILIGGDVVDSTFLSGYNANLSSVLSSQTAPSVPPPAQDGGSFTSVLIAGKVTNSVFAASVEPASDGTFGTTDDLFLPHGRITAKVEGGIDNSTATPDSPTTAFYAKKVTTAGGPVVPPTVPEGPFPNAGAPPTGSHVAGNLQPTIRHTRASTTTTTTAQKTVAIRRRAAKNKASGSANSA